MRIRLTDNPRTVKTAAGGGARREIPDDFKYNPKKLKHLKHILHNVNVALGTLTSCLNEMSKIKGPDVSPDGLLGGAGYIIPLRDIKQTVNTTVHDLGNIADCIADELTNPKWSVKEKDEKDIKKLIKEKEDVEDKVEEVEDDINPDDLVTAEEYISDKAEKKLKTAVKKDLVNFFHVNKRR